MGGGTSAHAAEPPLAPVEVGGRRKPRLAYLRCQLIGTRLLALQRALDEPRGDRTPGWPVVLQSAARERRLTACCNARRLRDRQAAEGRARTTCSAGSRELIEARQEEWAAKRLGTTVRRPRAAAAHRCRIRACSQRMPDGPANPPINGVPSSTAQ